MILEGRDVIGGTWDLFRYPGIRSDSDMYTLGFSFRPWHANTSIADGASILAYIRDTARTFGIDQKVRFGHRVKHAAWSSETQQWSLDVERNDGTRINITCQFLMMCSGYYNYDAGYTPDFPGMDSFQGQWIHPQHWSDDIDHANKRVIVIASGATAVTLIPALANDAAHVTMLQRSPSYIISQPTRDKTADWLRTHLPDMTAYRLVRWKYILLSMLLYNFCRRYPKLAKRMLIHGVRQALGPDFDIDTHFTPHYNPWDQRLCLVPYSDLFKAIKKSHVSVVTDHIERITPSGIALRSGQHLDADMIVSATGLDLLTLGGVTISIDGQAIDVADTINYRGAMFSGIPNMAMTFGYTNASWTLKCELNCQFVCRLLNHMDAKGYQTCVPQATDDIETMPIVDFSSTYIQRVIDQVPRQGTKRPWRLYQNFFLDQIAMRLNAVEDGVMQFS